MRPTILLLAFLGLVVLPELRAVDPVVVARSGDTEIRAEELGRLLEGLDSREQTALARNPSSLNQAVRIQLAQKIVLKEALSKKWDKRPETLAQVEQLRQNFLAESYLKSISTPPDGFPSAAEVKAAYEAAKESLRVPKQFRLAQIFVAAPPKPDKDADDKIRKRLEPIGKQPDSFAAFARAESEDKITAPRGGEIGWVAEAQIQAEIRSQVVKLARNAVSDPIRLNDGWHLIKLLDVKESFIPPLEDVKEAIARQLRAERTRVNSQAYLAKLLKENPVTINEIAIAQQVEQLGKGGKSPSLP